MKSLPKMPQRAKVRIWVASLHQETAPRNVSFWVLFVCSNPLFHDGKMTAASPPTPTCRRALTASPTSPATNKPHSSGPAVCSTAGPFSGCITPRKQQKPSGSGPEGFCVCFGKRGRMDRETKVLMQLVQTGNYSPRTAAKPASRSAMMSSMCSVPMDRRMVFW